MKTKSNTVLFFGLLFLSSCYKDQFKALHPDVAIDTSGCDSVSVVSYSAQIVPIINDNCINCHGAGASPPDLSIYSGVQGAAQTNLYSSVIWDGTVNEMPQNSTNRLPVCDLNKLRRWIAAGAPNN